MLKTDAEVCSHTPCTRTLIAPEGGDGPNVHQWASQPWKGTGLGACCKTLQPWGAAQGPGPGQDGGPE